MHAFSVAVFLMGVSAVMAAPAHHEGDAAMPQQTVGEAAQSFAGAAHVAAAVEGLLDHSKDQTKDWMADHGVADGEDEDDWEEDDNEDENDNGWFDQEEEDDRDDMMPEEAEVAPAEMPEEAKKAFGNEWSEESAEEVHESGAAPGEEDVEAEMPADATYAMSYDAAGEPEEEMPAEGAPELSVEAGATMPEEASVDAAVEGHAAVDNSTVSANATLAAPANATAAAAAEKEMSCTISAAGYSPKEMTVKPGSKVSFKVDAEGEYTVKQTAGPTSCEAVEGGFASKAMLKGEAWTYTVPQDAKGKMYMYSGPADKCDPSMLASMTIGDNLVAGSNAPSAAGTAGSSIGVSAAASVAPALASVVAAAVIAARSLF